MATAANATHPIAVVESGSLGRRILALPLRISNGIDRNTALRQRIFQSNRVGIRASSIRGDCMRPRECG